MAARLTIGKEGYDDVREQVEKVEEEASACLRKLKDGVQRDIAVFNSFMDVLRMPKTTDEEKQLRTQKLRQASDDALQPPLCIAENSFRVIDLACRLAPVGNKNVISDVGVAAALAEGALKAALWSVEINLASLNDSTYEDQVRASCEEMQASASQKSAEVASVVEKRIHS
jgi:formiminotetrahydrofolate cyclodeaminase